MPIYEYRCLDCSHQEEHLQKVSEPQLTVCPSCGNPSYRKLLSAAGFHLKGSGWYATDFRNQGTKPADKTASKADGKPEAKTETKTETKAEPKTEPKKDASAASTPAVTAE